MVSYGANEFMDILLNKWHSAYDVKVLEANEAIYLIRNGNY